VDDGAEMRDGAEVVAVSVSVASGARGDAEGRCVAADAADGVETGPEFGLRDADVVGEVVDRYSGFDLVAVGGGVPVFDADILVS